MENQVARILKEYKKGNKMVVNSNVKDFVEILLSLDEKLDDTIVKSLVMVHPYPKLFLFLQNACKFHFLFFIDIVWCKFILTHETLIGL
jgi:hypothetical protein